MPVHPRVCGEQGLIVIGAAVVAGSSPRVRGTGPTCQIKRSSPRFIPACAGNSAGYSHRPARAAVHPRVCGEQFHRHRDPVDHRGSSPRVRGTVPKSRNARSRSRFIPACAGNSGDDAGGGRAGAVHPRVCGEQVTSKDGRPRSPGSSPRVRGTVSL